MRSLITPQSLRDSSPVRGAKNEEYPAIEERFILPPLKGEGDRRQRRWWRGSLRHAVAYNPSVSSADSSPFRGAKNAESPVFEERFTLPSLKGTVVGLLPAKFRFILVTIIA
jgi:hypothetical protein